MCCLLNETDRFSRQFPRDNNFLKVKRKFLLTIFFKDFPDVRFEVNFKIICLILQFLFFKILSAKVISNSFSRTFQKLLLTITRKTIEFNSVQRDSYSSHANCCTFENILWVRKQELHAYINSDKIPQLHSFQWNPVASAEFFKFPSNSFNALHGWKEHGLAIFRDRIPESLPSTCIIQHDESTLPQPDLSLLKRVVVKGH